MKKITKILGVAGIAAFCGAGAHAQINYQNGDLLAAFRDGSGPDIIVDLGSIASFQQPNATSSISFSGVNSALSSVYGSTYATDSSFYWSVFGVNDTTSSPYNTSVSQTDANTVWTTLARSNPNVQTAAPFVEGNSSAQEYALGDVETIAQLTNPNQAGAGLIVNLSPNIVEVSTSLGGYTSEMTGAYNGNLNGDWNHNIENHGDGTSDLYQADPGNSLTQHASDLGSFTLSSSGFTFDPVSSVPEPSSWVLIGAGFGFLFTVNRLKKA